MALHRPCLTPGCPKTVRIKYKYCDACRVLRMEAEQRALVGQHLDAMPGTQTPQDFVAVDQKQRANQIEQSTLRARYKTALETIDALQAELLVSNALREAVEIPAIRPAYAAGTSEGVAVISASDWHYEEIVDPRTVNNLNEFNPEVADVRITRFFQGSARLLEILQHDIKITKVVLALLGDFITNELHEAASAESNALTPMHAIVAVQARIVAGINFLLNHTPYDLVIPCHVGNHGRTTKKVRSAHENGHSLEYYMYFSMAQQFANEARVQFKISDSYHSYLEVYGLSLRFHHGHFIQYHGGVGGLYIPANKAIAQWDKARPADLDFFGHFHQQRDGGQFLSNGSLIGFNSYAVQIKAEFEPPRQTLTLIDKKRGRTCVWPIWLGE